MNQILSGVFEGKTTERRMIDQKMLISVRRLWRIKDRFTLVVRNFTYQQKYGIHINYRSGGRFFSAVKQRYGAERLQKNIYAGILVLIRGFLIQIGRENFATKSSEKIDWEGKQQSVFALMRVR